MTTRPCLGCGRLIGSGSRCPGCRAKQRKRPERGGSTAEQKFRRLVLAQAGGRCERCGSTVRVEAHHRVPLAVGGSNDPSNGTALCSKCHRRAEPRV